MRVHAPLRRLTAAAAISAMAMSFTMPAFAVTYTAKQLKLPQDNGLGCEASDMNDEGQITGACYREQDGISVGFITEPKGKKASDFGLLDGTDSYTYAVNNNGVMAGEATVAGDTLYRAVLRMAGDSKLIDLGSLGSDNYAAATGINDNGQIVGFTVTTEGNSYIFGPASLTRRT